MRFPYDTFVDLADFYRKRDELSLPHAAERAAESLRVLAKDWTAGGHDEKLLTRWVSVYSNTRDGFLTRDPGPEAEPDTPGAPHLGAPPANPTEQDPAQDAQPQGEGMNLIRAMQILADAEREEQRQRRTSGIVALGAVLVALFGLMVLANLTANWLS